MVLLYAVTAVRKRSDGYWDKVVAAIKVVAVIKLVAAIKVVNAGNMVGSENLIDRARGKEVAAGVNAVRKVVVLGKYWGRSFLTTYSNYEIYSDRPASWAGIWLVKRKECHSQRN